MEEKEKRNIKYFTIWLSPGLFFYQDLCTEINYILGGRVWINAFLKKSTRLRDPQFSPDHPDDWECYQMGKKTMERNNLKDNISNYCSLKWIYCYLKFKRPWDRVLKAWKNPFILGQGKADLSLLTSSSF